MRDSHRTLRHCCDPIQHYPITTKNSSQHRATTTILPRVFAPYRDWWAGFTKVHHWQRESVVMVVVWRADLARVDVAEAMHSTRSSLTREAHKELAAILASVPDRDSCIGRETLEYLALKVLRLLLHQPATRDRLAGGTRVMPVEQQRLRHDGEFAAKRQVLMIEDHVLRAVREPLIVRFSIMTARGQSRTRLS